MTSRDEILQRLRTLLADDPPTEPPPVHEVWPRTDPSTQELLTRFAKELAEVDGELIHAANMDEARGKLLELLQNGGYGQVAIGDRPLCRDLTAGLQQTEVLTPPENPAPADLANVPVGLLEADYLLADTGSAMVACNTPCDRLLCYLPPVCVVAARVRQMREHMPAAWEEIAAAAAEGDRRGEFVFITGPSRTADIEKILILGVHGPKRLIMLVID